MEASVILRRLLSNTRRYFLQAAADFSIAFAIAVLQPAIERIRVAITRCSFGEGAINCSVGSKGVTRVS